jgi:hypothetical protein
MNQAGMASLLSASSVMLAAFGFVFNSWRENLEHAMQEILPEEASRIEARRDIVSKATHFKAVPLALASTIVAVLFLPDGLSIVRSAITSGGQYDALRAAFVAMELFWLLISGSMLRLVWKLYSRILSLTTALRKKQADEASL